MRKKRVYLAGVAVAALAVAVGVPTVVADPGNQEIIGKVTPKKLPKKKFRNAKIRVDVNTRPDPGEVIPPLADVVNVDFSKNIRFKPRSVPRCRENLEDTTKETAELLCGNAKVSKDRGSRGTVKFVNGQEFRANITAFNGPGRRDLTLHSRVDDLNTTVILVGTLRNRAPGRPFGSSLRVPVPLIGGGSGAITEFRTTVKKRKFVQARCRTRRTQFRARATYSNHEPTVAKDTFRCKPKKQRGRR